MTAAQLKAFLKLWRNDLKAMREGTYQPPNLDVSVAAERFDPEHFAQGITDRAERIKTLRARGMSVAEIADRLRLSMSTIYRILRGRPN